MGYNYDIQYKVGGSNRVVNARLRIPKLRQMLGIIFDVFVKVQ